MKELAKKHESKLRYAAVGGFNTALDFVLLFVFTGAGVNKYIANYMSTSIAFLVSFFANRKFAFKSNGNAKKQFLLFTVVTLSGLWLLQPAVIWLAMPLLDEFGSNTALFIAKAIATGMSLVWNYLFYSRVIFKD